jgi:hypothetical protein
VSKNESTKILNKQHGSFCDMDILRRTIAFYTVELAHRQHEHSLVDARTETGGLAASAGAPHHFYYW